MYDIFTQPNTILFYSGIVVLIMCIYVPVVTPVLLLPGHTSLDINQLTVLKVVIPATFSCFVMFR